MLDQRLAAVRQWIQDHRDELISDTVDILRVPSLEGEPEPLAPFGRDVRDALDLALQKATDYGMETKDVDGFAGYAEVGSGGRLILSLGHLDVVPPGSGWQKDPFGALIEDGWIYARGACDDKGPTMASLHAARAIAACWPDLGARIRIVFGCNEESGMKCVKRYLETEEAPTYGISPDAGWPLAHAEKGISNIGVSFPMPSGDFALMDVEGGDRPNMVVDRCEAKIRVANGIRPSVEANLSRSWDRNVEWSWDGDILIVRAHGKSAHGAHPFAGDSAGIRLWRFLMEVAPEASRDAYKRAFESTHISGVGLGIHGQDDVSRDLTCNLGIVSADRGRVSMLFNVRYPVTWDGPKLRALVEKKLDEIGNDWRLDLFTDAPPLFFPLEHPMVTALTEVVKAELGIDEPPIVMGGGTYARVIPNTVSVGAGLPGDGKAHEADERIHCDHLVQLAGIYAHMLVRLATLDETNP